MKSAFITGVTGQDGAYLAKNLLEKGYKVVGGYRRTSGTNFSRLNYLGVAQHPNLELVEHDLTDLSSNINVFKMYKPQEVYNLAAQSFVGTSFDQPSTTAQITGLGALNLLEAIRITDDSIKYYQASTSEMFGLVQSDIQSESTDFYPRSPYGVAKLFAHWMTVNYRESYGIFGASGILFNHESPLRGKEFVTRKITESVARISEGSEEVLYLGNLDALRDWGYAEEYVEGMWRMLQTEIPETFVLATGKTTSVRDFVELAFNASGIQIEFEGSDQDELARDKASGRIVVQVNPKYYRPAEVHLLHGDASKAKNTLDWEAKVSVRELAAMMVEADINRLRRGSHF
jgi:GDPmannose 4,6-dehydratase